METASDPDAILVAMEQGFYNKAEYNRGDCTDDPERRQPVPLLLRRRRGHDLSGVGRVRLLRSAAQAGRERLLRRHRPAVLRRLLQRRLDGAPARLPVPRRAARAGERHGRPAAGDPRRHQDLRRSPDRGVSDSRRERSVEPLLGLDRRAGAAAEAEQVRGRHHDAGGADRALRDHRRGPTTSTSTASATPAVRPSTRSSSARRAARPTTPRPTPPSPASGSSSRRSDQRSALSRAAGEGQARVPARRTRTRRLRPGSPRRPASRARPQQPPRQRALQPLVAEAQAAVAEPASRRRAAGRRTARATISDSSIAKPAPVKLVCSRLCR